MSVLLCADQLEIAFPPVRDRRGRTGRAGQNVRIGPIDLTLHGGELCVIRGPSLSGKSVVLGGLAGLHLPSNGSVLRDDHIHGSGWSLVPQTISLLNGLTIGENIVLASRLALVAPPDTAWVKHVVGRLGLNQLLPRTPSEASYGECHRIMLARSLCIRPTILLIDEPFAHQDPEMCAIIAGLVNDYLDDSNCCVIACRRNDSDLWNNAATTVNLNG